MQESTIFMRLALGLAQVLAFYNLLLWVRIILSWFAPVSHLNQNSIFIILKKIVDPYLNLFRNVNLLKTKNIDFTPLLAFALLSVLQSILHLFGTTGQITFYIVLALILNTLWGYLISPFLVIITIIIVIRLILCFKKGPNTITLIRTLESIIGGFLSWIQKVFFSSKIVSDRKLLIVSTIFCILVYITTRTVVTYLISYLINL